MNQVLTPCFLGVESRQVITGVENGLMLGYDLLTRHQHDLQSLFFISKELVGRPFFVIFDIYKFVHIVSFKSIKELMNKQTKRSLIYRALG